MTLRGQAQAKILAISERDLLVGQSFEEKPKKATDGTAIPDGSIYLERNSGANTVAEFMRVDGEWVFQRTYGFDKPIESLLAEQVELLQQVVFALNLITGVNLEEATG